MLSYVILLSIVAHVAARDIFPTPLKRCRLEDETCLKSQAQTFVTAFKKGLPELSLPSLEPLDVGTLNVKSGQGNSLLFNLELANTKLHNFGNSLIIKSLKGFNKDLNKPLKLTISLSCTDLEVRADYDVNGKVLLLPIISKGNLTIKMDKVLGKSRISAEPVKHADGHTYLKVTDYKTQLKVNRGHFDMSHLFNENPELRDATLKLLNDEWNALSQDIQPKINEALDRALLEIVQKFWQNIPYDEFFL